MLLFKRGENVRKMEEERFQRRHSDGIPLAERREADPRRHKRQKRKKKEKQSTQWFSSVLEFYSIADENCCAG